MSPEQLANRWQGKLKISAEMPATLHRPANPKVQVELRKSFGASVLIKIFDRQTRKGNKLIHISMNEAARMSAEDLSEMNLAIYEAIEVYRHPAAWIKLNKDLGNT